MKKLLALVAVLAATPAFAQNQPASEASVRELMAITNAKSLLDQTYGQLDGVMERAMKEAMGGKTLTPEQDSLLAEMRTKMVALFREQMSWEKLEPEYLKLYMATFSQAEVDGMNAFYKSPGGQAVIAKMPQLMQSLMQAVVADMQALMPKMQALENEYKEKVAAAGKK
jgi:hypothetical protein